MNISQTVARIIASYNEVGGINHLDGANLPTKDAIEDICEDLLRLAFPGYLDASAVLSSELESYTERRVARVAERLKVEACKSLRLAEPDCPDARSISIVENFFDRLPAIRQLLRTDVEAAYEGDPAAPNFDEIILAYPCVETIAIQRMAHVLYRTKLPLIPRMMTEWAHSRTGIDIHPGAQIGSHFFIDHGTGVVIGETTRIGSHVKLYHGVTLGAKSFQKDEQGHILKGGKRHPDVEDNVTIYPNATILGGDTVIGEHSTIGGNVFLTHSIPPNSLVYPQEIHHRIIEKRRPPGMGPTLREIQEFVPAI
ncbi:MAG TPA: serine O-acetyltransferase EpsC [Chthoniobacterales bacterium]